MSENQSLNTGVKRKSDQLTDDEAEPFVESGLYDDEVTFVFDDSRELYVSRGLLCCASAVFRTMFRAEFKEKSIGVVKMKGKEYEDVLLFLQTLHPGVQKPITEKDMYKMLPLAEEYQVKRSIGVCKDILRKKLIAEFSNVKKGQEFDRIKAAVACFEILMTAIHYEYENIKSDAIETISRFGSTVYVKEENDKDDYGFFKSAFGGNAWLKSSFNEDIIAKQQECRDAFNQLSEGIRYQIIYTRLKHIDDGRSV